MLELSSMGFPHNSFYALDLNGVRPDEIESFLRDGLRNFKSKINCQLACVRVGLAGRPEFKLFLAPNLDANDDELILSKMREALVFLSEKHGGYSDGFIIIQEWTPETDYLFSLNLMPQNGAYIIEAVKGNHFNIDRLEAERTIIKLSASGHELIKSTINPDEIIILNRLINRLSNKYLFKDNCVYELSFLSNRPSFYQVKKPGQLYKHPLSKQDFYHNLKENKIPFESRVMRK
jgi:hypothetical protein